MQTFKLDYNKHWEYRGKHNVRSRFKIFADIIKDGSKVLDIGCGDGTNLRYLMDIKVIKGYGIDISKTAVDMAMEKGVKAFVKDVSRSGFKLEDTFDYIIISELLEHIPNPEDLILGIKNNFTTNLLISIPNVGYFKHRLRFCIGGRFPIQWRYHPAEHLRYWTTKDFKKWCIQLGFVVKNMIPSNGIPILKNILPNLFSNQVVFVLQK
jgi:methionine biosynthesis protein MetW